LLSDLVEAGLPEVFWGHARMKGHARVEVQEEWFGNGREPRRVGDIEHDGPPALPVTRCEIRGLRFEFREDRLNDLTSRSVFHPSVERFQGHLNINKHPHVRLRRIGSRMNISVKASFAEEF